MSACALASAGSDVTCSPPSATYAPRRAVVVRDAIGTVRRGDVDLDDHQVRRVVQVERLHVLVLNLHVVVLAQVRGQRGQAERRNSEYLMGRQNGLVASVSAGRIILTFTALPPRR